MDRLIPLFFLLYVLGVVASAVLKKVRGMDIPDVRPKPVPVDEGPLVQAPDPEPDLASDPVPDLSPIWAPDQRATPDHSALDTVGERRLSPKPLSMSMSEDEALWDDESIVDEALSAPADDTMPDEWQDDMGEASRLEEGSGLLPVKQRSAQALTPATVREAIIFVELLSPPRALRPYRVPYMRD